MASGKTRSGDDGFRTPRKVRQNGKACTDTQEGEYCLPRRVSCREIECAMRWLSLHTGVISQSNRYEVLRNVHMEERACQEGPQSVSAGIHSMQHGLQRRKADSNPKVAEPQDNAAGKGLT